MAATGCTAGGQPAFPDPVLLQVVGFDALTSSYKYRVNSSFGSSATYRALFQNPYRISVDVAIDVGPDQERLGMYRRLGVGPGQPLPSSDSAEVSARIKGISRRPVFRPLFDGAEELRLSPEQLRHITVTTSGHEAFRDSVYDALAGYLATRRGDLSTGEVQKRWHAAVNAVARSEWNAGGAIRTVLTEDQAARVFDRLGMFSTRPLVLDERELERYLARWNIVPF